MALTDKLTNIANAIRAKTGDTAKLSLDEMASAIEALPLHIGDPVGILDVGTSVWMNVGGVRKEFIIVHQGIPNKTQYDESCKGTWLLMKDLYTSMSWDGANNDYENSDIHSYLNSTFFNLFDSGIKSTIKQIKIPYRKGSGQSTSITGGANGLSTKVFLLSRIEVGEHGGGTSYAPNSGSTVLDYFDGAEASERIAYFDGSAAAWWLRTASSKGSDRVHIVRNGGDAVYTYVTNSACVRPALILPSETLVDGNFNIIAPEVNIITFTIGSTTYEAVEGMTWAEWVASDYNTGGLIVNGNHIMSGTGSGSVSTSTNSADSVRITDTIIAQANYHLAYVGGAD